MLAGMQLNTLQIFSNSVYRNVCAGRQAGNCIVELSGFPFKETAVLAGRQ
jgi:hypothetical protein